MVKLRLSRAGRKKAPIYKIVAADSRSRRDGKFIEQLGQYDPNHSPAKITLKEERALYWLKTGAQPTVTVRNILSGRGLLLKYSLLKKGLTSDKIDEVMNKWLQQQESKQIRKEQKKLKLREKKKTAAEKSSGDGSEGATQQAS
ncbi:MAG: 30S ribosomal protein S16 [Ignavibacteria bacterium]|nr:30S ribosomal protein S16 [Ignavibacteria bacterium]